MASVRILPVALAAASNSIKGLKLVIGICHWTMLLCQWDMVPEYGQSITGGALVLELEIKIANHRASPCGR